MDNMIGHRIKERRKELKITQSEIQQKTSISSGNLSCIENGKYLPSAVALIELANILNCTTDWILTGKSQISDNSYFLDNEEMELIDGYRLLSPENKEELLGILILKLRKSPKDSKTNVKSSNSNDIDTHHMVG